jgi:hypothetical protein
MRHVIGVTELFPLFDRQGRRSVADPCHTTVRAGPYTAVRVGSPNTAMACANCSCLLLDNGAGVHSRIVGEITRREPTELPGVPRNPRSDR